MFELKLEDVKTLFANEEELEEAKQSFPMDPKGDLSIQIQERKFSLQKNVLGRNSAYFGQLATIKYLHMIEIQDAELDPQTFT